MSIRFSPRSPAVCPLPTGKPSTLDQGTNHGIQVGQAVIDAFNFTIIGRITDAGSGFRHRRSHHLATPARHRDFSARQSNTAQQNWGTTHSCSPPPTTSNAGAPPSGDGPVPAQPGFLAYLYLDPRDNFWPRQAAGFVIGKVTAVETVTANPLLYRRITVQPILDLPHLQNVIVLVPRETPITPEHP